MTADVAALQKAYNKAFNRCANYPNCDGIPGLIFADRPTPDQRDALAELLAARDALNAAKEDAGSVFSDDDMNL